MSKRTISLIAIIVGLVLIVISVAADALGIGNRPGFGWHQTLGVVAGVVLVAVAIWWRSKKS